MKSPFTRFGAVAVLILALAGCGGSDSDAPFVPPPPDGSVAAKLAAAATDPANDTSVNSSASFTVLQDAGVPAVIVKSPPQVNFAVFSDGAVLKSLAIADMSFVIAKLVPGANGDIDEWVSYVSRTETATAGVGPGGVPVLPSARQATSDPKTAATLVANADGYYTYTFTTDITNVARTMGVEFEPDRTHRIAIQLSYKNAAGETVRVNPYFDFTIDGNGNSVAVTDPSKTRKMADVGSCNGCHEKLALHGGGRVDMQFCVMCHNPGTTDANSGNVLTMQTMVHKIHSGRLLKTKLVENLGGEDYTIWGFRDSKHSYAEVGFPQDLRNCNVCHSADNPKTPQGDNWKTRPSKESCLTCHANLPGSEWDTRHAVFANTLVGAGAAAKDLTNAQCAACHVGNIAPERVHFNQNEQNSAKYKMNIESVTFNDTADKLGRSVTVKYFLSDPTNNNEAYDLVTPDCTSPPPNICGSNTKFGNLQLRVAYQNLVGQSTAVTDYTAWTNGGAGASASAYRGLNDGSNRYTVDIPLPNDTATAIAAGTARVVSLGQIKEPLLQVKWATDPRPQVVPTVLINTVVQHASTEFAISGLLNPRRTIVSNEKCNVCHSALGTTSGSNTVDNAFHGGARNTVEACVLCHDSGLAHRSPTASVMTNGLPLYESFDFKRMIHGIHGNSKRTFPLVNGNRVQATFNDAGVQLTDGIRLSDGVPVPAGTLLTDPLNNPNATNYAAEVSWPGVGVNCNACHVDNSYKLDRGRIGSVVRRAGATDPMLWEVITPQAATCTSCHDSSVAIGHVTSFGGAGFGSLTQAQSWFTQETCTDCHSSGGFLGVDVVHRQR